VGIAKDARCSALRMGKVVRAMFFLPEAKRAFSMAMRMLPACGHVECDLNISILVVVAGTGEDRPSVSDNSPLVDL